MRIDIIFSDLDGTLLLGDKGLSPGTAEALARAAERGISFVPATGRFFNAIPRAVQELPFWRYAIVMNGAVVWDRAEGRAIRRAELSPELAVRVMARLEDFPGTLDCYMEDNCGWMEARYYAALDDWILDPVSRRIIREMRRPMEDLRGYVGRRGRPVQKIQSYFRDEATQRAVLAALAEEFNTAMETLKENGTFDALVDKYISKNEDAQLPELKTVENPKGALVMGTNCEFEPFEYLDENGDPTGFDVGFAQYLCAEMGYTLTIENMDFDALIPALQSGRIDFIAAGLTRDEEREKNANFTDGYYEAIQSIVVAKPAA